MKLYFAFTIVAFFVGMFTIAMGNSESDKRTQVPLGDIQNVFKAWEASLTFPMKNGDIMREAPLPELPKPETRPLFKRKRRQAGGDKDLR